MPRPFPVEYRRRAIALVRAGQAATTAAVELGVSAAVIHNWVRPDQIDRGERPGVTKPESIEMSKARKRIRQLEEEVAILRTASKLFEEDRPHPRWIHPMIDALVASGHRVKLCCRLLSVSSPSYYRYKNRPLSPTQMRRQWLTGLIREVHTASRETYGSRRVHAELTLRMGVTVSERLVAVLISDARIVGLPGPVKVKRLHDVATADDLVHRKFHRLSPNELWVTAITEHPTRERKVFCYAIMDTFSRKIIGWSIDSTQDTSLVLNALDLPIESRKPATGGIVHADHITPCPCACACVTKLVATCRRALRMLPNSVHWTRLSALQRRDGNREYRCLW